MSENVAGVTDRAGDTTHRASEVLESSRNVAHRADDLDEMISSFFKKIEAA